MEFYKMALNLNYGGIEYPERMRQLKDFRNLVINQYTPTDIDFAYDWRGNVFIFGELKCKGQKVPTGQHRFLMGLLMGLMQAGKKVLYIVAEHETEPDEAIDVGNLIVTQSTFTEGGEIRINDYDGMTVQDACNAWMEKHGVKEQI
jgi:hypothetical protein